MVRVGHVRMRMRGALVVMPMTVRPRGQHVVQAPVVPVVV
jgi:hypothetical protein